MAKEFENDYVSSDTFDTSKMLASNEWKSIEISIDELGSQEFWGRKSLTFDADKPVENHEGGGNYVITQTQGTSTRTGTLGIFLTELHNWYASDGYPKIGLTEALTHITDLKGITIVAKAPAGNSDKMVVYTLSNCKFSNDPVAFEQSGTEPMADLNFTYSLKEITLLDIT